MFKMCSALFIVLVCCISAGVIVLFSFYNSVPTLSQEIAASVLKEVLHHSLSACGWCVYLCACLNVPVLVCLF